MSIIWGILLRQQKANTVGLQTDSFFQLLIFGKLINFFPFFFFFSQF